MKILSVHTPKVGGTSLLMAFKEAYGDSAVFEDYSDRPADPCAEYYLDPDGWGERRPTKIPDGVEVVHGHFFPHKYDLIDAAFRMTFLRHPVDNMISIFFYWKKYVQHPTTGLSQYFLEKNLDIYGLARLPLLRHLFSKTYFGGFDMKRFDFIGCHEKREESFASLSSLLGVSLNSRLKLNQTNPEGKMPERLEFENDTAGVNKLKVLLADDIRFYEDHVSL